MAERTRLRLWEKTVFGSGAMGTGVVTTVITSLLLLFYNQAVGLPPDWVGAALMISIILDALWDPLIGHWTDNVRTRWGRRHPFMYVSAPCAALGFYLLLNPPLDWSKDGQFWYLLAAVIGTRFFASMYDISSSALVPELAPDYDDRTNVWSFRFFFGLIGALSVVMLAYQVYMPTLAELTSPQGYAKLGLTAGLIILVAFLFSAVSVHRLIPRLRPPAIQHWSVKEIWNDLASVLRNRTFVVIMLSGLISGLGTGLTQNLTVYFNTYYWRIDPQSISALAGATLLAGIVGTIAAPPLSRRLGKKTAMLVVFWGSLFVSVIPLVLSLVGILPPAMTRIVFWVLLADVTVAGILGYMGFVIIVSLLTDVVEDNAAATGRRTEGLLFAFNGILQKASAGIGAFVAGRLLLHVQFPANAVPGMVDEQILRNLVLIYVPITFGLASSSLLMLSLLKVGREKHEANLAKIESDAVPGDVAGILPSSQGIPIRPEGEVRI
ncbi:MAG: MFS transporter [Alphaproteobacteria bacterium]|nr:MFS transporter [Alphaproteobacteria bacterium]